ncbi:hypothetical protein B5X24_HaOG200741 [Helicoverpa armigera]|uniref:Uncharacterized protein n=1 Tax=Helicoverpa armigera TaxID=29058 RepID=A0A2W1BRZ1_HELAM|nr:hypothetical protein B5X24_HaOG200741 [Helicoverpa armigera]
MLLLKLTNKILLVWIKQFSTARNLEDQQNEDFCNKTFRVYRNIQEIYMTIGKTNQYMVRNFSLVDINAMLLSCLPTVHIALF